MPGKYFVVLVKVITSSEIIKHRIEKMMRIPSLGNIWIVFLLATSGFLRGQSSNTPELMGDVINSEYNEIGPVISPDGKTLFFSRVSHPQNANGDKGSQDIWYSEFKGNRWANAVRMPNVVNKDVYNAIYSITPDGNTILLKGSYNKGVYQTRGFSISKRVRRSWSAPETMLIPDYEKLSKGEFDCAFLTNEGNTLIISFSEKKKGRNDDLYVSFKDKEGKWSKPQSLGSDINTPNHMETTPFLAADGLTLYFSSDRPGGKGGNDIYSSRRLDGSWKRWTKPVNLGPSVNTPGFEGYYSVAAAGDFAYWSSNNEGVTRKGDVYRISLKKPEEKDTTKATPLPDQIAENRVENTLPDPVAMISGKVLDSKTGKPLEASIVFNSFPDGREIGRASTDPETGEYKFTLPFGAKYSMRPVARNFIAETEMIDLTDAAMAKSKSKDLLLKSTVDLASADSLSQSSGTRSELIAERDRNATSDRDGGNGRDTDSGASNENKKGEGLASADSLSRSSGTGSGLIAERDRNATSDRDGGDGRTTGSGTSNENKKGDGLADTSAGTQGKTGEEGVAGTKKTSPTDRNQSDKGTQSGDDKSNLLAAVPKDSLGDEKDVELVSGADTVKLAREIRDSTHIRTYQEFDKTVKAVPIEVGGVVRLNNIFFETASSRLRAESRQELDLLVQTLKEHLNMRVELGGHTDNEGSEATNQRLSQARTNAVRRYLINNGIVAERVESVGYGESRPIDTNETADGRQANRRVEFTILQK